MRRIGTIVVVSLLWCLSVTALDGGLAGAKGLARKPPKITVGSTVEYDSPFVVNCWEVTILKHHALLGTGVSGEDFTGTYSLMHNRTEFEMTYTFTTSGQTDTFASRWSASEDGWAGLAEPGSVNFGLFRGTCLSG